MTVSFEFATKPSASSLIDEYLNKTNQMEVDDPVDSEADKKAQNEIIWTGSWDRDEYEKYFFKELMEELVHVGEEQQTWQPNSHQY